MNSRSSSRKSESREPLGRVDEIRPYYKPIECGDKAIAVMFWVSAVLSFLVPYSERLIPWQMLRESMTVVFVLTVMASTVTGICLRFHLVPLAEQKRRKQLISNALGVPLTPEVTHLYYNNELPPSLRRLGANVMENTLFAKSICGEMAKFERFKVGVYAIAWIVLVLLREPPLAFICIATQLVFSSQIVVRWMSVEYLRVRSEAIYDEMYKEFLGKDLETSDGKASILDALVAYETAKSVAGIQQSTKIFNKLNPTLTMEWDKIRRTLGIDEALPVA